MIIPTMAVSALAWINENLEPDETLFEWNSGDSTFWYADRAKQVYSVTDSSSLVTWLKEELFVREYDNVKILLAPEDSTLQEGYAISSTTSFKRYCYAIEQFPTRSFDWIIIDGYKREKCLPLAMQSIKYGGVIVMTETDVPEHLDAMNQMLSKALEFHHFKSVSTTQDKLTQTTVMRVV